MSMKGKPVLNESLALESAAYLAMWKALETFNPNADRWAEPHSLGSVAERLEAAEEVVDSLRRQGITEKTLEDIQRFREFVKALRSSKAKFSREMTSFARYLRDHGSDLARRSVSHATGASRP